MDKTGSAQKIKSKNDVASMRSKNVWSKSFDDNFYLNIFSYVAFNGFVVTPMSAVPVKILNRYFFENFTIEGSVIYVSQKGFMNSRIFI